MRRQAAGGFTLIEVLLATTLLAAALSLAFAILRASTVTVERSEQLAKRSERMRSTQGFLRRRLMAALPMRFDADAATGIGLRFHGEADRMRFVADLPNYLGQGGPYLHDISVDGTSGQVRLLVDFTMVVGGRLIDDGHGRQPEQLASGLSSVRFSYRGVDAQGRLGEWADRWAAGQQLPLQVRIEIDSEADGAWPPLVVALPQASERFQAGSGY